MSAQLHLSILHVIWLSCQTLHVSWAHLLVMTAALVTPQSLKFVLNVPATSQLGCTYQIPHGTQLTLSGEDMPVQMQSPGYKNASRY